MVFRIKRKLTAPRVEKLNAEFADLVKEGRIEQSNALPEEANEEGIFHLPRLIGTLKRREFGRLRQFIDRINTSELVPAKP